MDSSTYVATKIAKLLEEEGAALGPIMSDVMEPAH